MLDSLNKRNIFPYHLLAISMGGYLDQAQGMFYPDSHEIIEKIAKESDALFINTENIEENIKQRMQLYKKAAASRPIKAFVNIGGATPNYGDTPQ